MKIFVKQKVNTKKITKRINKMKEKDVTRYVVNNFLIK